MGGGLLPSCPKGLRQNSDLREYLRQHSDLRLCTFFVLITEGFFQGLELREKKFWLLEGVNEYERVEEES